MFISVYICYQGDVEPVIHPVDSPFGTTTVLVIIVIIFAVLLVAVDVTCYFANGCGLTMCICVHLCGHGVGEVGTSFKTNEKEVEEGERCQMISRLFMFKSNCNEKYGTNYHAFKLPFSSLLLHRLILFSH